MGRIVSIVFLVGSLWATTVLSDSLYDESDHVLELNNDNFNQQVYNQKRAFIVEFYSSWCGACIAYAPTYKKFARLVQTWSPIVQVTVVNCADDKNMPLCREHAISAFPTLKYFKYMSVSKDDGELFKGDKHNINSLPFDLAALVQADYENQKPPEWPSFNAIDPSTTLADIWSTSPKANLLALVVDDQPSQLAWANTLNFYGNPRVRTAFSMPAHPLSVNTLGSVMRNKLVIFEKGSDKPVFISGEKIPFAELQEKVNEFLLQAVGDALDKKGAESANAAPTPAAEESSKDAGVIDLSKYQVQQVDLESALGYMLTREVVRRDVQDGENLKALKRWLQVLKKYAPGTQPTRRLLFRLHEWIEPKERVTATEWTNAVEKFQDELGRPLPKEITWMACAGSKPHLRGYTCGVWTLAHAISVSAYKLEKSNPSFNPVSEVLEPFRDFIGLFLSCAECAANFQKEAAAHRMNAVDTPQEMVLWLWRVHNSVNKRLAGAPAEDPTHPKRQFPPPALCADCSRGGVFDNSKTLKFLLTYYGKVRADTLKPSPGYKVKEFQNGKVQSAGARQFNPRFGAVGVDKVDAAEESEFRLRRQLDSSPQRHWKKINDDEVDISSPGSSQFAFVVLSIIAVLLLFVYCKYRRNRSKFWKIFYYKNDYKL